MGSAMPQFRGDPVQEGLDRELGKPLGLHVCMYVRT